MRTISISCRAVSAMGLFTMAFFILCAARPASAAPTVAQIQSAYASYNGNFLCQDSKGNDEFAAVSGNCSGTGFWTGAELIEMAVDAYAWAKNADPGQAAAYLAEVHSLCLGFSDLHPQWWNGSDQYDDDMLWATIAFVRAYDVTGASDELADAEAAFATVYNHGRAGNGGIYWNAGCESSCSSWYENSPANWTFVIAGRMLYGASGNSTYQAEADGVYDWAKATLYNSSTGEIYDGYKSSGIQTGEYSYNYGIAIGAASEEADSALITNASNFLMTGLGNYAGSVGGYNILPNYGQGNQDGSGFNGITMRWLGVANVHGNLNSTVQAWIQANLNQAYAERNTTTGLIWNNWMSPTTGTEYSWDESDALVGFFLFDPKP